MTRFMCVHTLPPNALSRAQCQQVADAAQRDPDIHGYRSFFNLAEGKILCVLDAPDRDTLARWFDKMKIPYDSITRVEVEGERGSLCDVETLAGVA